MRGRLLLAGRLVAGSLRQRPFEVVLTVVAIAAATTTLMLGLALHNVTAHPYETTRDLTSGPDVAAMTVTSSAANEAELGNLVHHPDVVGHVGPFPVAYATMTTNGSKLLAIVEGRSGARSSIDQPAVTEGTWVRPGGVVVERAFAHELSLGVGDRVRLDGRSFRVDGLAVTAAVPAYPHTLDEMTLGSVDSAWSQATGLLWSTESTARRFATPSNPLTHIVELRLADPAAAPAFANAFPDSNALSVWSWQDVSRIAAQQSEPFQRALLIASSLLDLLAVASLVVIVGGRLAERTRRVGLLKAVGATPGFVSRVLMLEYVTLALAGAAIGLVAGYLVAPFIADPGAGLIGSVVVPAISPADVAIVVGLALVLALVAALIPCLRAARTSTTSALADAARVPKRRALLVRTAAHLPVPGLLGLRLAARRPRRMVLTFVSVALTSTTIVAVLSVRAHEGVGPTGISPSQFAIPYNPNLADLDAVLAVITACLVVLAAISAVVITWAASVDSRRPFGIARALGATTEQLSAGLSTSLLISAVPGAVVGVPLGLLFVRAVSHGSRVTTPSPVALACTCLGVIAVIGVLSTIPARLEARGAAVDVLESNVS